MALQQRLAAAARAPLLAVAAALVRRAAALDSGENLRAQTLAHTLALSSAVGGWRRGDVQRTTVRRALRDARGEC